MDTVKIPALDITITQEDKNLFKVTGKDAPKLYDKLIQVPAEARNLEAGELKDGVFTLRKVAEVSASV